MDLYDCIQARYSVRAYQDKEIPNEVLRRVMEAARLAPSASNRQDWKFIIIKDPELKQQVAEAARRQMFIAQAPIIIAGVSLNPDRLMSCEVPAYAVDFGIAMEHIALAAVAEGLGTCWIGDFSQSKIKQLLQVPEEYKVVELMPIGYPASPPRTKVRKRLEEIISINKFA